MVTYQFSNEANIWESLPLSFVELHVRRGTTNFLDAWSCLECFKEGILTQGFEYSLAFVGGVSPGSATYRRPTTVHHVM